MSLRKHRLIGATLAALGSLLVLPALAGAGSGQGATQVVQSFTRLQPWFGPDDCTGLTLTGTANESVTQYLTLTGNGGVHERDDVQGSVDLYQANGPGPWDPQPGAFIGTWTYQTTISDQAPPDGQGSTTAVTSGWLVFPDGSSALRQVLFHITWQKDGPPKLVFAKFLCSAT
jgi:hypothetical protein